MNRRHTAALAATAIAALGLAACGGEEGANIEEDPSTTVSPTGYDTDSPSGSSDSSGSDSEVKLPAAATKRNEAGAIAFAKFYWEQTGEALKSSDPDLIRSYSKGCDVCDGLTELAEKNASQGIKMSKNPNSIKDLNARSIDGTRYRVELTVDAEKYDEVAADGSKTPVSPIAYKVTTTTLWEDGRWYVQDAVRTQ